MADLLGSMPQLIGWPMTEASTAALTRTNFARQSKSHEETDRTRS
jgi:hypothetical protein